MFITNNPKVAKVAEDCGVKRVWVDLEIIGKEARQPGMNTVKSGHTLEDVSVIKNALTTSELLVRINPIYDGSEKEINEVINRGSDIIMLPPDFVIASPKNLHQRVWRFSDALPSTLSECIHPCSEVA